MSATRQNPAGSGALSVDMVAACQRSCNTIFDLVVQNMKVLRELDSFPATWSRVVSTLAANALSGAARGHPWWHDEMCDTLEALLRLLRLPVAVQTAAHRSGGGAGAGPAVVTAASPSPTGATTSVPNKPASSSGGLLAWLVAPLIAATEAPVNASHASSAAAHSEEAELPDASLPIEPSDGYLLKLSWEHICRVYPAFPACLRARDPKLHGRIATALALPSIYFQKNETRGSYTSAKPIHQATAAKQDHPEEVESPKSTTMVAVKTCTTDVTPHGDSQSLPTTDATVGQEHKGNATVQETATAIHAAPSTPHQTPTAELRMSVSPEETEGGDSLFSISLTDTPVRSALQEPYETPLADTSISIVLHSPVAETPSFVSEARSAATSTGRPYTSPYVKNLTPIFASAEGPAKTAASSREGQGGGSEESAVSPVRKMDPLLSPEGEAANEASAHRVVGVSAVTTAPGSCAHSYAMQMSAPSTPAAQPWQVYPQSTPLSPAITTPHAHQQFTPTLAPAPVGRSAESGQSVRRVQVARPIQPARKLDARIQIV